MSKHVHPWWTAFGEVVPAGAVINVAARQLLDYLAQREFGDISLIEVRQQDDMVAIGVNIEVERPQDLAVDIKAFEPVALVFTTRDIRPGVLALRADFPNTYHQNMTPPGYPASLCVDDRPWEEARLSYTDSDFLRRVRSWLSKAARGELHDPGQPLDPHFFKTGVGLILPPEVVGHVGPLPELAGFARSDAPQIILTRPILPNEQPGFLLMAFAAGAKPMAGRIRQAPTTMEGLAAELKADGAEVATTLAVELRKIAGVGQSDAGRLGARLALVVDFPVLATDGTVAHDLKAFITRQTAGEVGVALGVLAENKSSVGSQHGYVQLIGAGADTTAGVVLIDPVDVYLAFDRTVATAISGRTEVDERQAVLVGAGSLGSQLAIDLAREGRFAWTTIDGDYLLPHNLARHALLANDVARPKAVALAHRLTELLRTPATAIVADVLNPVDNGVEVRGALERAELILDATASVAVSRWLSDDDFASRRVSIFFNPTGADVVLLVEDAGRTCRLRDLEAAYYQHVLTNPAMEGHLSAGPAGVRYSGSCRALTNRISASQAALLSALASMGVGRAISSRSAGVEVWRTDVAGGVTHLTFAPTPVHRVAYSDWTISYSDELPKVIGAMRRDHLPSETGGALVGVVDTLAKKIHLVTALPPPPDSQGTPTSFERGIVGLTASLESTGEATLGQVSYVGEWHSHPRFSSTSPSLVDLGQLTWLTTALHEDGRPAIMVIVGDDDDMTLLAGFTGTLDRLQDLRVGNGR